MVYVDGNLVNWYEEEAGLFRAYIKVNVLKRARDWVTKPVLEARFQDGSLNSWVGGMTEDIAKLASVRGRSRFRAKKLSEIEDNCRFALIRLV